MGFPLLFANVIPICVLVCVCVCVCVYNLYVLVLYAAMLLLTPVTGLSHKAENALPLYFRKIFIIAKHFNDLHLKKFRLSMVLSSTADDKTHLKVL